MSLAKAIASKGTVFGSHACPASSRTALQLRFLATGRLSSSVGHSVPPGYRVAGRGGAALARGPLKGLGEGRSNRSLIGAQQIRSLGLFSGGDGVSHQMLKELEKKAARSPADASAEVWMRWYGMVWHVLQLYPHGKSWTDVCRWCF